MFNIQLRQAAMAAVLTVACGFGLATVTPSAVLAAPPGDLPFGAYDPGGDFTDDPVPVIEHLFLPWEDVYLPSLNEADDYAMARHRALLVTLEPWTWSRSERNRPDVLRKGIAGGVYDQNMRDICTALGSLKSPVTLRWAHEMEDKNGQFIWSNWEPATYIASYRRMIDICRKAAPSIRFMWSPLGDAGMEAYYPGDAYVDVVGISVFGLQAWDKLHLGHDSSYLDVFAPKYARAAAFGKPVVVAELGYSGDQAYVDAWENSVRVKRPEYPDLVGVVYFNQREVYPWPDNLGLPDWRINHRVIK
jgi:endoglucanase